MAIVAAFNRKVWRALTLGDNVYIEIKKLTKKANLDSIVRNTDSTSHYLAVNFLFCLSLSVTPITEFVDSADPQFPRHTIL